MAISLKLFSNFFVFLRTKFRQITHTILFYPITFALMAIVLLVITNRIDESISQSFTFDVAYLDVLIFAGGADAARSILSAIATGWATILGVSFSVTLISLQLSVSKYISHLVSRFEQDKINQIALSWFILTVTYSLLVLKTIRSTSLEEFVTSTDNLQNIGTAGLELSGFTPLIGVNLAIIMSVIGLLFLVVYLNNISSYLKPNMLVSKLMGQIFNSLKSYQNRKPIYKEQDRRLDKVELLEINSKNSGILSFIDSNRISKALARYANKRKRNIWIDYNKSIGDWVEKQDNIAMIYEYDLFKDNADNSVSSSSNNEHTDLIDRKINKDNNNNNTNSDNDSYAKHGINNSYNKDNKHPILNRHSSQGEKEDTDHKEGRDIEEVEDGILASMEITPDRDLSRDPLFGIELLRSLSTKSATLGDVDVIKSCITGLFRILHYSFMNKNIIGVPFTLTTEKGRKPRITNISVEKKENKPNFDKEFKGNDNTPTFSENNNDNIKTVPNDNDELKDDPKFKVVINPKEVLLDNTILLELDSIIDKILTTRQSNLIHHITAEYIALAKNLVKDNKNKEFNILTDWLVGQLTIVAKKIPQHLCFSYLDLLLNFKHELDKSHPEFVGIYQGYMKVVFNTYEKDF
ncbi:MAG: DUF2254 family protein [Candidatus Nitrosocosmicus sp.]